MGSRSDRDAISTTVAQSESSPPRRGPLTVLAGGTLVGRYVIERVLGAGGMGVVYAAYDPELERPVAIKLLRAGLSAERLRREAQALAKLDHPNVVRVYDVGEHEGQSFVAMALVEGRTLRQWRPSSVRELVRALVQAGRGLAAVHALGLIHRDVKPDNIFVSERGQVMIGDFGLVTSAGDDAIAATDGYARAERASPLTEIGAFVGTPAYMAPEQGRGQATMASDQYAFAVTAWEMLCGARPFADRTLDSVFAADERGPIAEPPRDRSVSRRIVRALERSLAVDPAARWPSVEALLAELEGVRARRVRRGALVAACVAAVLGGAFAISRTGPSNELTCRTGADRLAQTWSPVIAMQIHSAILGVAPYAQVSLVHAISRVDGYAARWRDAWDGICHAEMSEATRDLRAGCLEQRLGSLASASQVLRTPDRTTASHVLDVAFALPDLEICDDVATLHKVVSVPPEIAGRVRALENDIALGEMMVRAGKFGEASERLDRTRAEVESIGHIATLAHTELALALLGSQQRHNTDAKAYAEAALNHSIQANDDVALARSYIALAGAALANGDAVRSKELAATADVAVRRVGDPPRLRANLIVLDALQPAVAGDFADGVRRIPRAIAALDASRQSDRLATLYRTLGSLLFAFARFDEAERAYDQEVALDRELYGPNHPLTAESLGVRAKFHLHREEYRAAEADLEEQYRILRDALGEDHLLTLSASADTATIDQLYGRYDAAIDKLRRAADAFERDGGPRQAGTARRYLAEALVAAGRIGAAEREILRARAFEKEGDAVALLPYDVVIAYIRERQGRLDEARALVDRAETQVVKLLGPDNPVLNDVWLLRARIAIDERRMQQAVPLLARITSGSALADAKTLLVAVRAAMGDRAGARRAAADARGILDRIGPNARPELRAKLLR